MPDEEVFLNNDEPIDDPAFNFNKEKKEYNLNATINDGSVRWKISKLKSTFSTEDKAYVDNGDMINYPPKVGFFGEKTIPLLAKFEMAVNTDDFWAIGEYQGRELTYFMAREGAEGTPYCYMAYRFNKDSDYIYTNTKVTPGYMNASRGDRITDILGLDAFFMIVECIYNGATRYHIISTRYFGIPAQWTLQADITNIWNSKYAFNHIFAVLYFEEYNTLSIIGSQKVSENNLNFYEELWKVSNSTKIISKAIYNDYLAPVRNSGYPLNFIYDSYNTGASGMGCAYYNRKKSLLVIKPRIYVNYWAEPEKINMRGQYNNLEYCFPCALTHFNSGAGTFTNQIPTSQYKVNDYNMCGCHPPSDSGIQHITYDDVKELVYYTWRRQQSSVTTLYVTEAKDYNPAVPDSLRLAKNLASSHIESMDACPWAKQLYSIYIINNYIYQCAYSRKYGTSYSRITWTENTLNPLINGASWWIINGKNSEYPHIYYRDTCYKNGSTVTWYRVVDIPTTNEAGESLSSAFCPKKVMQITQQDIYDDDGYLRQGAIKLVDTTFPQMPAIPTKYTYNWSSTNCYYLPGLNKYIMFVSYNGVSPKGKYFILEYNCSTRTWVEHSSGLSAKMTSTATASTNQLGVGICYTVSNVFLESGYFFFKFAGTTIGGRTQPYILRMHYSGNTIVYTDMAISLRVWSDCNIGWNSKYTYYIVNNRNPEPFYNELFVAKNPANNAVAATSMTAFLNSNTAHYTMTIKVAPAVGCIAYIQTTPLFVGGYFSIVPSQEIALTPNATTYIYMYRDNYDRTKVKIRTYNKYIVDNSDGPFNFILAAKCVCDSEKVTSMTYYPLKDWWNTGIGS